MGAPVAGGSPAAQRDLQERHPGGARLLELGATSSICCSTPATPLLSKILDHVVNDLAGRLRETDERAVRCPPRPHGGPARRRREGGRQRFLFGFQIPDSIHGVDLDAIEVEATTQERATKDRPR
ncbi:MAG: hypothetical protein R3F43_31530 [bacterium]